MFFKKINDFYGFTKSTRKYLLTTSLVILMFVSSNLQALPQFFQNELVQTGLNQPTSIAFLPDDKVLVTQKMGQILILDLKQSTPSFTQYLTISDINSGGERGLLNVVIDPDFPVKPYIYVVYHRDSDKRVFVSRFTHDGNTADLSSEFVVWQDPSLFSHVFHHGGGLSFGPNGYLYLTTGEQFKGFDAQDLTKAGGKIIRIASDGSIPSDNPFVDGSGGNLDEIWAYGLRNPYRAHWDLPVTGSIGPRFFIGEVGGNLASSNEDIHIGEKGINYGWPYCEGVTCNNSNQTYDKPLFTYEHNGGGASVIGGIVYHGGQFPESYQNNYFYGDYALQYIRYLSLDSNGNVQGSHQFENKAGLVVDITEGNDGAIYYLQIASGFNFLPNSGSLRKISYNDGNQAPQITSATADSVSGNAPFAVQFSGVATDNENDPLEYIWFFGDGQQSSGNNVNHTYTQNGTYKAYLQVNDGGKITTLNKPIVVVVGSKPELTLQQPADGALFRAGDTINFSAIANDPDGVLSENNYKWTALFVHNEHTHPELDPVSGSSGSIKVPNTGHSFYDDTGLEITAEVTDSDGLSTIKSVRVYPEKVNVVFNSQPSGISFFSDEEILTTPIVYDNVINFRSVITAPQSTCLNGTKYDFVSWSNGKVASHIYIFPEYGETITATYTMVGSCNSSSNNSPFAFSDEVSAARGTGQIIKVLSNDIDSDGSLTKGSVIITGQPQYGSITTDSNTGNITYIHDGSSAINDSFTYTVEDNDGSVSNQATVLINIVENSCGNSLAFDGSNDWVNIPNLNLTNDFTIEAWVKFAQGVDNKDVLVGQEGSGQDINFFSGKMRLFDGSDKVTATTGIAAGEWAHVAITRSDSTLTAYLNGVVDGSGSWSGTFIPKAIGRGNRFFLGMFEGEMDEIRIWDVARSGSEISQNYNKKDVLGVGLVAYWNFDEGGQVVQDSSGLGNDGSLGESGNSNNDDPIRVVSSVPIEGACGTILTPAPRPIVSASSIVIDEFYNGNTLGSWVVQQPANTNFSYSVTAEKITLEGGVDNHHLTRVNTEIDPSRAYTMYSKFKVSTSGAVESYAMSFLQKNASNSDLINAWTLNLDFGSKQIKYMGFLNGNFRSIGSHSVPWAQTNKEYIYQIDVNRRKDGSFSPKWVTGKISDIYGTVLDHFEVDYSSFPWQPDLNEPVRIGLNSHGADWEAKDLMVWYADNSVGNHAPLANAGGDQIVSDSDENGSEIVVLDGGLSSDLDGDSLTYEWTENSIPLGSGQSINHSFDVGEHNVTLTVNDGYGEEANDNILIQVIEYAVDNISPETQADTATVQLGESVTINVLANDSDSDGSLDKNSLTLVDSASHGTVSIDTDTGEITYIHDGTPLASDNFTYTIADDQGAVSNPSTVTITVTEAEGSASCGMGVKLDGVNDWINIPDLTLANDFTVESWVKLAPGIDNKDALFGQEGSGSDINFYASKVRIFAGGDKITANTAILPDTWTHVAITRSGTQLELYINGVLDATGNWNGILSLKAIGRGNRGYLKGELDEVRVWNIARTGIEINASYNTDIEPTISGLIGYWKLNGAGQTVTDASNSTNDGTLGKVIVAGTDDPERQETTTPMTENCGSVIVDNTNEAPIANNDTVGPVQAGETLNFTVTDNDTDNSLNTSSVEIVTMPNAGIATVNISGVITYISTGTSATTDTLSYKVADTEGVYSNVATVFINVTEPELVNQAPIAYDDEVGSVQAEGTISFSVIDNDVDSDGNVDVSSVSILSTPNYGVASVNAAGTVTYLNTVLETETVTDTLTYTVRDTEGALSNEATVSIRVITPETNNEAPITQADTRTVQSGESVSINVLANDSDSDGSLDKNSLTLVDPASHGTVSIDTDTGEITYIHDGAMSTSDNFTYTIADDQGAVSNPSTVTITVTEAEVIAGCGMGVKLDGVNDWINIPDLTLANDFTVESWVKLAPRIDFRDGLFGQEGSGPDVHFTAGKIRLYAYGIRVTAKTPLLADTWAHIAFTRSGRKLTVYINGEKDATGSWKGTLSLKAIGRGNRGYFEGEIDEVRIWNIARTTEEIQASYNVDIDPRVPGLIGYWRLNGAGQTVIDASHLENDGSLGRVEPVSTDDPTRVLSAAPLTENCEGE